MSDLFDKRTEKSNRRRERAQRENQEKRKTRIIAVTVIAVVAVLFAGALFVNSNLIRRTLTAVTIGGVDFTAAEFDYFYYNAFHEYQEMVNTQLPDMAASLLPEQGRPLGSQIYSEATGETWADFFANRAIDRMVEIAQAYNAARAYGFVLPEEMRERLEDEVDMRRMEADFYSDAFPTFDSYLQALFGDSMNERVLRRVLEFMMTAEAYVMYVRDSFTYSPDDLSAFYAENSHMLDVYHYRLFVVQPETPEAWDFETFEEYEAALELAEFDYFERAMWMLEDIHTEEDFIATARAVDEMYAEALSTLRSEQAETLDETFRDWLMDSSRVYGDVELFDSQFGAYLLFFIAHDDNSYQMVEMRHILIFQDAVFAEDFEGGEFDPEYLAARELAEMVATERAENVLALFEAGGATESVLLDLMPEHSDDMSEGGFYDNIARFAYFGQTDSTMRVVEIEDWLFAEGRQIGDYELLYAENIGFHLVYFMGHGRRLNDFIAEDRLRSMDTQDFVDGFEEVEVERRWAFVFTR